MYTDLTIHHYRNLILSSYNLNPPKWQMPYACRLIQDEVEEAALPLDYIILNSKLFSSSFYIFGLPGYGKTKYLEYLAVQWAKQQHNFFPILVSASQHRKALDDSVYLEDFLLDGFVCPLDRNYILTKWQSGRSLLMLDDLDYRDRTIWKKVTKFRSSFPQVQVIATQQIQAYEDIEFCDIPSYARLILQNPNTCKYEQFITCWPDLQKCRDSWEDLEQEALLGNEQERKRAIKILARVWKNDPRTILFLKQCAIQDRHWSIRYLAIQEIAYGWYDERGIVCFIQTSALYETDYSVLFAAVQAITRFGRSKEQLLLLYHIGNEHVRYAVAHELASFFQEEALSFLKTVSLKDQSHIGQQGVIYGLLPLLKNTAELITFLSKISNWHTDPFIRWIGIEQSANAQNYEHAPLSIINQAKYSADWYIRQQALIKLARFWRNDSRVLDLLKNAAVYDLEEIAAGEAINQLSRYKHDREVLFLLKDIIYDHSSWFNRTEAIEALEAWNDNPEIVLFLKQVATSHFCKYSRQQAIASLVTISPKDPEILAFVQNFVANSVENYRFHRANLIRAFVRNQANKEDTYSFLVDLLKSNSGEVRRIGLLELADYSQEFNILNEVIYAAQHDSETLVRIDAIEILGRWIQRRDVYIVLVDLAKNDSHEKVRAQAFQTIAKYKAQNKETSELAQNLAQNDRSLMVNVAAIKALVYFPSPKILRFLRSFILQTEHLETSRVAFRILGTIEDPEIFRTFVVECIEDSKNEQIFQLALDALAHHWPSSKETSLLIQDRIKSGQEVSSFSWKVFANIETQENTIQLLTHYALKSPSEEIQMTGIRLLAIYEDDFMKLYSALEPYVTKSQNLSVCHTALQEIVNFAISHPMTIKLCQYCLEQYLRHLPIRRIAVAALARNQNDNPEIVASLQNCVMTDFTYAGELALLELIEYFQGSTEIIPFLKECALNNQQSLERCAHALTSIVRCDQSPIALSFLYECLEKGSTYSRCAALTEMVRTWPDHPQTFALLRNYLSHDEELVAKVALENVIRICREEKLLWTILKDCIQKSSHEEVYNLGVSKITKLSVNSSETLSLLKYIAKEHNNEDFRELAVQKMIEHWQNNSEVLTFVKQRAIDEQDFWTRSCILEMLVDNWKDDPQTLEFLKSRLVEDDEIEEEINELVAKHWSFVQKEES